MNGYNTIGCDLYDDYNRCLSCTEKHECAVYDSGSHGFLCRKCHTGEQPTTCLHQPDDIGNAGFGCPGNLPPINPDTHIVDNKKNYMC